MSFYCLRCNKVSEKPMIVGHIFLERLAMKAGTCSYWWGHGSNGVFPLPNPLASPIPNFCLRLLGGLMWFIQLGRVASHEQSDILTILC